MSGLADSGGPSTECSLNATHVALERRAFKKNNKKSLFQDIWNMKPRSRCRFRENRLQIEFGVSMKLICQVESEFDSLCILFRNGVPPEMYKNTFHAARRLILPAICGATLMATSAQADFISTWKTATNSSNPNGGALTSEAVFKAVGDQLTITLSNLTADPKSAGELLTRLNFTFSSGGPTSGILSSSSGQELTLSKSGNNPIVATPGSTVATQWALNSVSGGVLQLTMVGAPIAPQHGIIGPAGSGGVYTSANASLLGNHNPFLNGTATYVLNVAGLGASGATIASATFIYNTEANISVPGTPSVPEPSSVILGGMAGLMGLVGYVRARRRSAAAA